MIGVSYRPGEKEAVEEFFQLFKTPWEKYRSGESYDVIITSTDDPSPESARLVLREPGLFATVRRLLTEGQPAEKALEPALDNLVSSVRERIVNEGIPLIEVLPTPASYSFAVCLTHDIDFIGIRQHKFDHTMLGFLYRSSLGASAEFARGRIGLGKLLRIWKAAVSLPLVQLGLMKDFWNAFEWYLQVEQGISATYYLIPFKRRAGEKVAAPHASRRATAYDVSDIPEWIDRLIASGNEVGVHGIDAWHSVELGREELKRVKSAVGIRMHWLLADANTPKTLEDAGYSYDSTVGYNETIGFRSGTTQVYLPPGNQTLLELPMHIQDGALFFPGRLGLSDAAALQMCERVIDCAKKHGGVLTVLWHDRSHGPERFWGEFYAQLVKRLRSMNVWFASAKQVVDWFRCRRNIEFIRTGSGQIEARHQGERMNFPFNVRVHRAGKTQDLVWSGDQNLDVTSLIGSREEALASR